MKKALIAAIAGLASFGAALPALAAYNDVTMTTDTAIFTVNGITLNVTGGDAVLQTVTVDSTSLTLDAAVGSTITVAAPNLNSMTTSPYPAAGVSRVCSSASSQLTYTPTVATTITVTPSATIFCGGGGGSSGGGGGGSSASSASSAAPAVVSTSAPVGLQAQIAALLAQISQLQASTGVASAASGLSSGSFSRSLKVGAKGADVKALQVYLNAHGNVIAKTGVGSPGKETATFGGATKAALAAFQKANGLSPASGFFGPLTRAYVTAHP